MNFNEILIHWYSGHKRDMPWRKTKDPYLIWLSEVILQQTQVKQGLPYYESFAMEFPTIKDLAEASEEKVLKLWQGLGYYSRARNLHYTARYIAQELDGIFPTTYNEIIQLKGVGDYTASAIASICYDEPCAVVDGNVYRALSRIFGIQTPINSVQGQKEFKALAQSLLSSSNIGEHNQAVMEFGSIQCKSSNPDCGICPFSSSCVAFQTNTIKLLPVKIKKLKIRKRHLNYLVFISLNDRTILKKREEKGIWQNLYEFPLVETNGSVSKTKLASLDNFKTLVPNDYNLILHNKKEVVHKLSHQHLHTKFWIVEIDEIPNGGIPLSDIKDYPVPILIANFIEQFEYLGVKDI
jgi:A/G-specific adenine glycosylase